MKTRRGFLSGLLAAGVAPTVVPGSVFGANAPSNRITVGGVGIGGIGRKQLDCIREAGFEVVALCDCDWQYAKATFDKFPDARRYRDFRQMLSDEGSKVDAVYCGTPDHTHAIVTLAALKAKKHVCCVKPLTRSVEECRAVVAAARAAGTATQVTAESATLEGALRLREYIDAGIIGDVVEVQAWSIRPVWPQGMPSLPGFKSPVPKDLDWDMWIGPAAKVDFADKWPKDSPIPNLPKENWIGAAVYHPFNFRGWFEFGAGALGDMGCHRANAIYRALGLTYPDYVEATATRVSDVAFPLGEIVTYDYPKRGTRPAVRLTWYDGGLKPPKPRELGDEPLPQEGVVYIGTKGKILYTSTNSLKPEARVLDPAQAAQAAKVPRTLPRREGWIYGEWLQACKGGEAASCNFDFAQYITEFVQLGNLAVRTGKGVRFDAAAMKVTNNAAADELLRIPYRNGWTLA